MERPAFIHVDIDSPRVLMKFWGLSPDDVDLDAFYSTAMSRALELFLKLGIPATFFCVGEELRSSKSAARHLLEAHRLGHELANHTDSHPYNLTALDDEGIVNEIRRCSQTLKELTGTAPVGFRAPSYGINERIFSILRSEGFWYDGSAVWHSLLPIIKLYHSMFSKKSNRTEFGNGSPRIPRGIYSPDPNNWQRPLPQTSSFPLEIPVPRTSWLQMPFYNNFHLMTGPAYRWLCLKNMGLPHLVYLVHLIEFVDLSDGLPAGLRVHPTVRIPASQKIRFLEKTLRMILGQYVPERTDVYVKRRWDPSVILPGSLLN